MVAFHSCWAMAGMAGRGHGQLERGQNQPDSRQRGLEPQGGDSGCEQRFKGQTVAAEDEQWGDRGADDSKMTQK